MHELAKTQKELGVKTVQAEDEIAKFVPPLVQVLRRFIATSTSGPGLALKSEAIGLAVMAELPLVIIDVQRGGPSRFANKKVSKQTYFKPFYGRNGESPFVVISATSLLTASMQLIGQQNWLSNI